MRKVSSLFALLMMVVFLSASSAFAAPDNFNGIGYTSTYDQYPELIRGVPIPDGEFSPEQERESASIPTFHRGVGEEIAGLPVGSIFYEFNKESKAFSRSYCFVYFMPEVSTTKIEKVDYEYSEKPYIKASVPVKDAEKYFSSICGYFQKEYGEPSGKADTGSQKMVMWNLFDPSIDIIVNLADWYFKDNKILAIEIIKQTRSPEMEIFM